MSWAGTLTFRESGGWRQSVVSVCKRRGLFSISKDRCGLTTGLCHEENAKNWTSDEERTVLLLPHRTSKPSFMVNFCPCAVWFHLWQRYTPALHKALKQHQTRAIWGLSLPQMGWLLGGSPPPPKQSHHFLFKLSSVSTLPPSTLSDRHRCVELSTSKPLREEPEAKEEAWRLHKWKQ